jgi:hypothetical protein
VTADTDLWARLPELDQMCDAPSFCYGAGEWCEAANTLLQMVYAAIADRDAALQEQYSPGEARMLLDKFAAIKRATKAEAALAREVAAREQAERERDEWIEQHQALAADHYFARAEQAEMRLAEAEKTLREARDWPLSRSRFDLSKHIDAYFAGRPGGDTAE